MPKICLGITGMKLRNVNVTEFKHLRQEVCCFHQQKLYRIQLRNFEAQSQVQWHGFITLAHKASTAHDD
jgi:hypothetical protein